MTKRLIVATGIILLMNSLMLVSCKTNKEPVLMTIGDKSVSKAEFERIYRKNESNAATADNKSLDDYLELFINFKLKVVEAENMGMDTTTAFRKELSGYRKKLAEPYMKDEAMQKVLVEEAYQRMKYDVRASHILLKMNENAIPQDTLKVYKELLAIRDSIEQGADFAEMARRHSDDRSAEKNGGDLGYFTAFQMIYPFESKAYNTPVGKISLPFRTKFGYHIVKPTDKRPAKGNIKVAHIMLFKKSQNPSKEELDELKQRIDSIHKEILDGADFNELAEKHSEDPGSNKKGGVMPPFGVGKMLPEFAQAAFALKEDGQISKPIETPISFHVIKRLELEGIPPFDSIEDDLAQKVKRDPFRKSQSSKLFITKLKKEYKFEEISDISDFYKAVDTSYFSADWSAESLAHLNKPLFKIGDRKITQADFTNYLEKRHRPGRKNVGIKKMLDDFYQNFEEDLILNYEEEQLEKKYPEFKHLLQEYHDGILLFNLTDSMVWSKAVKDTIGLKAFYDKHKDDYMWPPRVEATVYKCASKAVADSLRQLIKNEQLSADSLTQLFNDTSKQLIVEHKKYVEGENQYVDLTKTDKGLSRNFESHDETVIVQVHTRLPEGNKSLDEARGLVISDYQNFLEGEWIRTLREKYTVKVNQDVLESIRNEDNN